MYMRRCLTSLVIKEIQIKAVMRNHFFSTFPISKYSDAGAEKWPPLCPVDGTIGAERSTFLEGISGWHLETLGKP